MCKHGQTDRKSGPQGSRLSKFDHYIKNSRFIYDFSYLEKRRNGMAQVLIGTQTFKFCRYRGKLWIVRSSQNSDISFLYFSRMAGGEVETSRSPSNSAKRKASPSGKSISSGSKTCRHKHSYREERENLSLSS